MIRVLIVDDSPTAREYLVYILGSDAAIEVVGTARDGMEAIELAGKVKPDVITMDIHMPSMDGIEATRKIMESNPVPIVIVSGVWDPKEVETTFRALEAGALAVVQRPAGIGHGESESSRRELISKVKLMSEVRVVRRWPARQRRDDIFFREPRPDADIGNDVAVVAIGASTGGPVALKTILSALPTSFPVPILIVQHIAPGFINGMIEWLSEVSCLPLHLASHGETMAPGHAYFAPDKADLGVDGEGRLLLSGEGSAAIRPSVSYLFRSTARVYGERSIGVLLTGMGRDGAEELKLMKERGAVTIVQDKESSVVFGMPGEALRIGAARYVLPPPKIGAMLADLDVAKKRNGKGDR